MQRLQEIKVSAWTAAAVVVIAGGAIEVSGKASSKAAALTAEDDIPLAMVRRGDVDIVVYSTGELRASHTMMLTAPAVALCKSPGYCPPAHQLKKATC